MKIINNEIISFLGEIVIRYNLGKDFIDDQDLNNLDPLERAFALFFNKNVSERFKNGEDVMKSHPFFKLKFIIDDLINNIISYEDLPILIKNNLNLSSSESEEIYLLIKNNQEIKQLKESKVIENNVIDREIKEKSIGYQLLK